MSILNERQPVPTGDLKRDIAGIKAINTETDLRVVSFCDENMFSEKDLENVYVMLNQICALHMQYMEREIENMEKEKGNK